MGFVREDEYMSFVWEKHTLLSAAFGMLTAVMPRLRPLLQDAFLLFYVA
jgi:hypothetical protein